MPSDVAELHKRVVGEIGETRDKEMGDFVSRKSEERKRADKDAAEELKRQKDAGVDVDKPEDFVARGLDAALAPADVKALPPSYAAVFSTKDPDDKLSGGTGTDVFNYN